MKWYQNYSSTKTTESTKLGDKNSHTLPLGCSLKPVINELDWQTIEKLISKETVNVVY